VLEGICPIIIESDSAPLCEGRSRYVHGKVRNDTLNACEGILKVIGDKVVCDSTKTEHNIFCLVLPHNDTWITLVEAQNLCGRIRIMADREETDSVNKIQRNIFNDTIQEILSEITEEDYLTQQYGK